MASPFDLVDPNVDRETWQRNKRRRLAIESPYLHRAQRRHFIMFNVLPSVGTVVAVVFALFHPIGIVEIGLFVAMWLLTGLGVSAGYHRLFTHRSFQAASSIRVLLVVLGSMAALGPVISWVAMHRRHHEYADKPGDMHSPNLHGSSLAGRIRGFVHAHVSWMIKHEYPNILHYAPDLLNDTAIVRASRFYRSWVILGLVLPAGIGGIVASSWLGALNGFLWGGVVRIFVVGQSINALNSVLHTVGTRSFATRDNSRNSTLLGLLIWGEGWHHNHHTFPRSASFSLAWYRVDIAYWFILVLKALRLAWNVHVPTREQQVAARPHG